MTEHGDDRPTEPGLLPHFPSKNQPLAIQTATKHSRHVSCDHLQVKGPRREALPAPIYRYPGKLKDSPGTHTGRTL